MDKRAAGILMPITSLPSEYGIGCFSKSAYDFVDWLRKRDRATGRSSRWDLPVTEILRTSPSPLLREIRILSA